MVDEKDQRSTVFSLWQSCVSVFFFFVFVCVYSVCVYLLYREVVELVAGEEAFANTRTGITWSTGLQTERKKRLFLFFFYQP